MNGSATIFPADALLLPGALPAEQAGAPAGGGFAESLAAALAGSGATGTTPQDDITAPRTSVGVAQAGGDSVADAGELTDGIVPGFTPGHHQGLPGQQQGGVGRQLGLGEPPLIGDHRPHLDATLSGLTAQPSSAMAKEGASSLPNPAFSNLPGLNVPGGNGNETGDSQLQASLATDPSIPGQAQARSLDAIHQTAPIGTVAPGLAVPSFLASAPQLASAQGQFSKVTNPEAQIASRLAQQGQLGSTQGLSVPELQTLQVAQSKASPVLPGRVSGETAASIQAIAAELAGSNDEVAGTPTVLASAAQTVATRLQHRSTAERAAPTASEPLTPSAASAEQLSNAQTANSQAVDTVSDGAKFDPLANASSTLASWKDTKGVGHQPETGSAVEVPASGSITNAARNGDPLGESQISIHDKSAHPQAGGTPAHGQPATAVTETPLGQRSDIGLGDQQTTASTINAGTAGGDPLLQRLEAGADRLKTPMPQPTAGAQVALQIIRSLPKGADRIAVQLQPAELGIVEIQLDIERTGRVSAVITAERPETLELLQRDSRLMERSLGDNGLKLSNDGLSFTLKQDQQQQQQQGQGFQEKAGQQNAASLTDQAYGETSSDTEHQPSHLRIDSRRLLDIRT